MKRYLFIVLLLLTTVLPSQAVLKEKNIASSLAILRQELMNRRTELERQSEAMQEQRQEVTSRVISVLQQAQQNSIMLYSQSNTNIFDLTYACHQATELYHDFKSTAAPFRRYVQTSNVEIERYDSLISDLSTMYTAGLTERSKIDRNVALTLAINIRRTLKDNRTQMEQYIRMYDYTDRYLKRLNDYSNRRYADIQDNIFSNAGDNYLTILSNLNVETLGTVHDIMFKYRSLRGVYSDWDSKVIFGLLGLLAVGLIVSWVLNYFFIGFLFTWLVKHDKLDFLFDGFLKKKEGRDPKVAFQAKRMRIIQTMTIITFAILLGVVRLFWNQNFIIMASGLLVQYAWLWGVILLSQLVSLDAEQIRSGLHIYLPIMVVCFLVIFFRIVLIPNSVVTLVFPPLLVLFALWQWRAIVRHYKKLPKNDVFYSYVSLVIFVASVISSMVGYTLLAVEMIIWWTMQLTCILSITCVSSLLKNYGNDEDRQYFSPYASITRTWLFLFVYQVVLPAVAAISVILSIYWAADVFNLSDTTWRVFNMKLIDSKNFTLSILGVTQVVVLFFVFKYLNHTAISILQHSFWTDEQERAKEEDRPPMRQAVESRIAMWRNVIQVVAWGIWLLVSMNIFNINNSWLVAISAGLSTGIGFAMKDILENIYYGISLMAGRIKVGDYISIDNTRGTVKSISYVSTTLEALDGSVITFQNSQLFTKNYKNLTKNHGNELDIIPVGVAYGSNAGEVRQIIADAVKALDRPNYIRYLDTVFYGFGDNSIDFKLLVWVDSRKQIFAHSDIMSAVYKALSDNHIEIPYPQRDLHIVTDSIQTVDSEEEAMALLKKK